jgi:hypothetical protein
MGSSFNEKHKAENTFCVAKVPSVSHRETQIKLAVERHLLLIALWFIAGRQPMYASSATKGASDRDSDI